MQILLAVRKIFEDAESRACSVADEFISANPLPPQSLIEGGAIQDNLTTLWCRTSLMVSPARFIFATCQQGAENALKVEVLRESPNLRFAYSRPGFVTFKQADDSPFPDDFQIRSVFARVLGVSLGKCVSENVVERAKDFWRHLEGRTVEGLHVFPRDRSEPGHRGYEPGLTHESTSTEIILRSAENCPLSLRLDQSQQPVSSPRPPDPLNGPLIADAILVDCQEWWIGLHRARRPISSWPGGFFPAIQHPDRIVSRVFFKMHESLVWAGFPLEAGQNVAEIGCSPGGASQVLLAAGLKVVGIDPAEVDPLISENPNFRHIRKRSKDVSRREFNGVDWLTCDINLPPSYTLDTVESVVMHPKVRIRGLILTLKLIDWSLAAEIPAFVERVRGWGYSQVRVRQLHHNRQEVCLVAR